MMECAYKNINMSEIIGKTQGLIFQDAACKGYNMDVFVTLYMQSEFCRCMDQRYSRYQMEDPDICLDIIIDELGNKLVTYENDKVFIYDVAEWIGYIYRILFAKTSIPSKELIKIIPFENICEWYMRGHIMEDELIIDDICQRYKLKRKEDFYRYCKYI